MPNEHPDSRHGFSAFPSAAAEGRASEAIRARRRGTTDERTVLALEAMADQLGLIDADIASIDSFGRGRDAAKEVEPSKIAGSGMDRLDRESVAPAEGVSGHPDVVRSVQERFGVGGYLYTDLQHAIAEAKRARRAGLASVIART